MLSFFGPRDDTSGKPHPSARLGQKVDRHLSQPLLNLLRTGITPHRLAWSLAVGVAVGVNPVLGSTTLACLAVAFLLRLNIVASQITNHLVFPAQLALAFPLLHAGELLFHTGPLPLERQHFLHDITHHTWHTTRLLWMWEWHALVVWFVASVLAVPLLALVLTPVLERLLHTLQPEPAATT